MRRFCLPVLSCWFVAACGGDDGGENVLPTQGGSDSSSASTTSATATTTATTMSETSGVDSTSATTGGEVDLPATYRFNCLDVQVLGDSDMDMQPDGGAIQANVLQNQWQADIDAFKLSIMLEVVARDAMAGTAQVGIRSGIGADDASLCSEPSSETAVIDIGFAPDSNVWQPLGGGTDECAEMGATSGGGTYQLELGAQDVVYVYAQDTDGTVFNCTQDAAVPDAVPIRAVVAEVTADVDNEVLAGYLTGCVLESEAESVCSCLGMCVGDVNPDCGDCPSGSDPLRTLLGNVGPTENCTTIMGANAYDLGIAFRANLLPNVPATCG